MRVKKGMPPVQVGRLTEPGLHFVGDPPGLILRVTATGTKGWLLRVLIGGKRRDMGLGGYPAVTLAQAREKAREARGAIDKGIDPVMQRRAAKSALVAEQARLKTFDQAVTAFMDARAHEWKNAKHRQQWQNTLAAYASPVMGALLVRDVQQSHVEAVLRPIWREKTETATRVRQRIERVLDFARASGWRDGENPAVWKGRIAELFPKPSKIKTVEHHRALAPKDMPPFVAQLRSAPGLAARALELVVLTAARSGEVRGMTWDEVDLERGLWTVPAGRMKAGREHRVALPRQAIALLKAAPRIEPEAYQPDLVFPAPRGGQFSDMAMTAVLRRMGTPAVVHGMRSSFRVWGMDHTDIPRELLEVALAHQVGSDVERAYARSDMIDRRRGVMQQWADFCDGKEGRP